MEYNKNRGDKKPPHKKQFSLNSCAKNTMKSLREVEYFLNNLKKFTRCMHLYKFFKK